MSKSATKLVISAFVFVYGLPLMAQLTEHTSNALAQQPCDTYLGCDQNDSFCDTAGCDSLCGHAPAPLSCLHEKIDSLTKKFQSCLNPSDHCFDDFISPMINFVHFEDPRNLTELRPIFISHQFPSTLQPAGIPAGGSVQVIALQFRIALTDRLSLIGVKDGYIFDNSEGAVDGLLASGWADITAGLKYNLIRNAQTGTLLSTGFTYEIPMGSEQSLQSVGDGEFHLFASLGQRFCDGDAHLLSSVGYRLPIDSDVQTTSINWNNHFDVRLTNTLYAFTELAWWHWSDDADSGLPLGVAGQDLFNFNVTNVDGNDLVTQNVGLKYKPNAKREYGIAYEFPVTGFEDVIDNRVQLEAILRY